MKRDWVRPWCELSGERALLLQDELVRELSAMHPLHGVPLTVIARHAGCDDVLVRFDDGSLRVAEVHLTFRGSTESAPYPISAVYLNLEAWALERAIHQEIELCESVPRWVEAFTRERARLVELFPEAFVAIEHIGSTAVSGLAAKPVIDIVAVVDSMEAAERLLPELCAQGYSTSAEFNATLIDRKWLMRYGLGGRTHHLHLVLPDSVDLSEQLRFRDTLRSSAELRMKYRELKERLASSFGSDREGYTDAKTDFIRSAIGATMQSKIPQFSVRAAVPQDAPVILRFIRELADFEKLLHEACATEQDLQTHLFGPRPVAEVVIGEWNGTPVAFALFFSTFSTFLGKPGIYLEDLYVTPEMRGKGCGTMLLSYLAHLAVQRGCGRLEWSVLDWNESAIRVYRAIGAKPQDEWTVQRLTGEALSALAKAYLRGVEP